MKKFTILMFFVTIFVACEKKNKVQQKIDEIPVKLNVERFDKEFYESSPEDLPTLKQKFPDFFPEGNEDVVWTDKLKDTLLIQFHDEVQKKFGDFAAETNKLEELFRHIKFYFPQTKVPTVVTTLSDFDPTIKAIYNDKFLILPLDLYLGSEHPFYVDFPKYQRIDFNESQLLPNVVASFASRITPPPTDRTLLSQMIYAGKQLYLKDLLLPDVSDADKIAYTPEQIEWSKDNEGYVWRYFVDEKLLYDADSKLPGRFINPAPFSKFYLEIDNESPGRIGMWVVWQIVRSYMENNDVSLQQLLQTDAKEIFDKSKYKPKK